jgi:hypothetical protein
MKVKGLNKQYVTDKRLDLIFQVTFGFLFMVHDNRSACYDWKCQGHKGIYT